MSESDSGPYCICGGPDNHRFMIACDRCEDWFHGECIDMDKYTGENLVQRYICPRCSVPNRGLVTRYKKMCSLDGCNQPAKIYEDSKEQRSIFCSPEHCNLWWDQLLATLPRTRGVGMDNLSRQEFMGLLNPPEKKSSHEEPPWRLGDEPFGMFAHVICLFLCVKTHFTLTTHPFHHSPLLLLATLTIHRSHLTPIAYHSHSQLSYIIAHPTNSFHPSPPDTMLTNIHTGVPPNFWQTADLSVVLTPEERSILDRSAADRHALGEEIGLCKKMLQLLDMAYKRREAAIHAGKGTAKDLCGYDTRLDTVGAIRAFSVFLKTDEGEAVFSAAADKKGRLEPPLDMLPLLAKQARQQQVRIKQEDGEDNPVDMRDMDEEHDNDDEEDGSMVDGVNGGGGRHKNGVKEAGVDDGKLDPLTVGMCTKKKCKTHSGWFGILSKNVKHIMKELAADAKEKLDTETRVRANAAGRYRRKMKEDNRVVVLYHSSEEEMSGEDEDEVMGGQ